MPNQSKVMLVRRSNSTLKNSEQRKQKLKAKILHYLKEY